MTERLAFVEAGDPASPPVVLLHGWATSPHLWRDLVAIVSPWMRAIAPDLPDPCDLTASTAAVKALLDDLGVERFAVVGHAEGGAIAQMLAIGGGVEAMVLVDAVALDAVPGSAGGPEATLRASVHRAGRLTDELVAELTGGRTHGERTLVGSPPGPAELERLEIPTLVMWGEDDVFLPSELAERLGDALPRASIALLPGCGHLVTEDAAETVIPIVFQYLRSQYLQTPHLHDDRPVTISIGRRPPPEEDRW
ncbi:MAG TPA: alpha/beta fold hydrolase [Actinomycetota bacterium]